MIFRMLCETAAVIAIGFLAGFANNALSSRSIPLVGRWNKTYGVPSPGGINDATRGNVEIGVEEAIRLSREKALFLDARPAEAYAERHILGAHSLPEDQTEARMEEVLAMAERHKRVVVYCQSMDCDEAHLLAKALREAGVKDVFVFAGGLKEWEEAGYPLAQSVAPPAPSRSERGLP
jgi:rhodanese-related sulfurtransferase